MRRYDRDGDGMLSEQEVSAKLWRRISKLDKDQDGLVSTEELRKRRQRRRRSKK
jgi:Ca2+-binding EF-hand superfamily protein